MAEFDVYRNGNPGISGSIPYLLDVRPDLLDMLVTRAVVPLMAAAQAGNPVKGLNPKVKIEGNTVVMSTAEIAGAPVKFLGEKIGDLASKRDEILAAIDLLLTGI